jgi:prophage regulatory protein
MRVISFPQLKSEKGVPYSQVWVRELIARGEFPKPIKIGANRVAFIESEIDDWLRARAKERDTAA